MPVPALHIMLKPASGLCNMRCAYCFYADTTQKREKDSYGLMTEDTLRAALEKALAHTTRHLTIAFQGGEPTLAGLDFFRSAVRFAREGNVNRCQVAFALQTNGLLLDAQWCEFLHSNHFLVGVSLDGPKELHDQNRLDAQGQGTHRRVMESIRLLEKHRVETNVLTVITSASARHFRQIHRFYQRNRFFYQQYIPCLDPFGEKRGGQLWSLSPARYEQYLKSAFDCWFEDLMNGRAWYHRYFDNLLMILGGRMPEACGMNGICGMQYVVEADGSVFPCDFYMLDPFCLGNLNADTMEQIDAKREVIDFIAESKAPHPECGACKWADLCRGGCRRDRDYFDQGIGKNYYCAAYRAFFESAYPRLVKAFERQARPLGSDLWPQP